MNFENQVPESFRPFAPTVCAKKSRNTLNSTAKALYVLVGGCESKRREMTAGEQKLFA